MSALASKYWTVASLDRLADSAIARLSETAQVRKTCWRVREARDRAV